MEIPNDSELVTTGQQEIGKNAAYHGLATEWPMSNLTAWLRDNLGFTAEHIGALVGVGGQNVYQWDFRERLGKRPGNQATRAMLVFLVEKTKVLGRQKILMALVDQKNSTADLTVIEPPFRWLWKLNRLEVLGATNAKP